MTRSAPPDLEIRFESLSASGRDMCVERDAVAHGARKLRGSRVDEWIAACRVLQPADQNGEAKRVETGVQEFQIVGQRRQALVLLRGDRAYFLDNDISD